MFWKFLSTTFRISSILWLTATHGAFTNAQEMSTIAGSVPPQFISDFVVEKQFQIPAILFFNERGCLVWSGFGPDVDFSEEIIDSLQAGQNCEIPPLPKVIAELQDAGIPVTPNDYRNRPVLIWYASEELCTYCAGVKRKHWEKLEASIPANTARFVLEMK